MVEKRLKILGRRRKAIISDAACYGYVFTVSINHG